MYKKCVSVCLVLLLVFSFAPALAADSFSFADAFGVNQPSDSGSGQSTGSFSFADVFEANQAPDSGSGQSTGSFSFADAFGVNQPSDSGSGQSTGSFSFADVFEANQPSDSGSGQSGDPFSFPNSGGDQPSPAPAVREIMELEFRNGIKFGMTVDQVKQAEGKKPTEENWGQNFHPDYPSKIYCVTYKRENMLGYTCDIQYQFSGSQGELLIIYVSIARPGGLTYEAIVEEPYNQYREIDVALTQKYGEPDQPETIGGTMMGMATTTIWEAHSDRNFRIAHGDSVSYSSRSHYIYYYFVDPGTRGGV